MSSKVSISFRHLATFVHACESSSMAQAAAELELAPSSLSAQLSVLEQRLGTELFRRRGRSRVPLEASIWFHGRALRLLLAEEYLHLAAGMVPGEGEPERRIRDVCTLRIDEQHASSAFGRALVAAIRAHHARGRGPYLDLLFTRDGRAIHGFPPIPAEVPGAAERGILTFQRRHLADECADPARTRVLGHDGWTVVSIHPPLSIHPPGSDATGRQVRQELFLPDLPADLLEEAANLVGHGSMAGVALRYSDIRLQELLDHLFKHPDRAFFVPGSLVPGWLRIDGISFEQVKETCNASLVVSGDGLERPEIAMFLEEASRHLAAGTSEYPRPFRPSLSIQQVRLFGMAMRSRSLTMAARVAGISAPALFMQLSKMEQAFGRPVFVRSRSGARATPFGEMIEPFCTAIDESMADIFRQGARLAARQEQVVRIGLPASWGRDCMTSECVADALTAFNGRFGDCRVDVIEATRDHLYQEVRRGALSFAVVGRVDNQVGCLPIGESEDVSLIVSRSVGFTPREKYVSIDEIARLPMLLAPDQLTMHRTFLNRMKEVSVTIKPAMQLGSIPLIVAMVRRMPFCTILPQSILRPEVEAGLVDIFPLPHIAPRRRLWVIFSTETGLTTMERSLIADLRSAFASYAGRDFPHDRVS